MTIIARRATLGAFDLSRAWAFRFPRQGSERIERHHRIEVEHQAVTYSRDRLERNTWRLDLGLEVEHQAHDARRLCATRRPWT